MKLHRLIPYLLILALAVIPANEGQSQQPEKSIPNPPYVAPLPSYGHWVVTLKNSPQAASPVAPPASADELALTAIDTVKTNNTKRVILSFKNGSTQQIDQVDGYFLMKTRDGLQISIFIPDAPPYPFYTEGFLFVENVGPATFKGVVNVKGTNCFHYQDGAADVWIAVDTMLPVAAKRDGIIAYFQFFPPPQTPIALTPDAAAGLQKRVDACNAVRALR